MFFWRGRDEAKRPLGAYFGPSSPAAWCSNGSVLPKETPFWTSEGFIQSLRAFRRAMDSQEASRVDDSTLGIEAALNNEDEECKVALSSWYLAVSSEQVGVSRKESVRRAVSEASDPIEIKAKSEVGSRA